MNQWKKFLIGILTVTLIVLSGAACAALFMGGFGMPNLGYAETFENREESEKEEKARAEKGTDASEKAKAAGKTDASEKAKTAGETDASEKAKAAGETDASEKVKTAGGTETPEKKETSEEIKASGRTKAAEKANVVEEEEREKPPVRIILETEAGPEGTEESTRQAKEKEDCVLLFAGDVYLSSHVLNAYDRAGGIHGVLDEGIREEIAASDIFMVNQEFPFTERGTAAADKQFTFRLPIERMQLMNEMGIDIVTLANNHILDFGPEGLLDSLDALDEAGILHVGGGKDLEQAKRPEFIEVKGRTIGFLGTSRVYMDASWAAGASHPGVFSTYDSRQAVEAIREAKELCDYLVVYVHWGVERETTPKEYQRVMGREYIDAGADLVIGSHPHVLQPMEYYEGKPIVYSLGNFVFGSSIPNTELFKVTLREDGAEITEIPCTSSAGFTRLK